MFLAHFLEPVKWIDLGLFDYPRHLKNPMDLGTIDEKMVKLMYDSPHDAAEDIRLVWSNCMMYNGPNTPYYLLAKKMSTKFEEEYAIYEAKWGQVEL